MECLFGDECPLHGINCALCDFHETQFNIENWLLRKEKHNLYFYVLDQQGKKYPENFHLHREFILEDVN